MDNKTVKCGIIPVTGPPNVGKSSLINTLVGEKISITTTTPRTTRYRQRAVRDRSDSQMIFVDTPSIINSSEPVHSSQMKRTRKALSGGDVILQVFDAVKGWTQQDQYVTDQLDNIESPRFLVANKIDRLDDSAKAQPQHYDEEVYRDCLPVSAQETTNLDRLLSKIKDKLSDNPRLYPANQTTDRSRRFRVSEIIREQTIRATEQEVPHAIAVIVESIGPGEDSDTTVVEATIHVERDTQKGIIIGEGGHRIKSIGTRARPEISKLFPKKIYLDLRVETLKDWTKTPEKIQKLRQRKIQ